MVSNVYKNLTVLSFALHKTLGTKSISLGKVIFWKGKKITRKFSGKSYFINCSIFNPLSWTQVFLINVIGGPRNIESSLDSV